MFIEEEQRSPDKTRLSRPVKVLLRVPLGPEKHAVCVGERRGSSRGNAVFASLNESNVMNISNQHQEPIW